MSYQTIMSVQKIIPVWDMRRQHALRDHPSAWKLEPGQIILAFNKARTMFAIVDCTGGLYKNYKEQGARPLNVERLQELLSLGWNVQLDFGKKLKKVA